MTITVRNRLLGAFVVLEAIFAGLCLACIAGILLPPGPGLLPHVEGSRPAWLPTFLPLFSDVTESLAGAAAATLLSFLGGLWIVISFRKATAKEIICFAAFLCSLSFESLRAVIAWTSTAGAPLDFVDTLTRAVWFGRTAGILSLFVASLYASGFEYEEPARALGMGAFVALVVAAVVPLESVKLAPSLLLPPGYGGTIAFIWIAMGALSLLNFFMAAFRRSAPDYLWMAAGYLLLAGGRDGLLFSADILLEGLSAFSIYAGLLILVRRSYRRSLLD